MPWPWKATPGIMSPLKSVIKHSPPQPTIATSVPFDVITGAPGGDISMTASQVPSSIFRSSCSGPGLGIGGIS
jgi:hypothetical protein